MINEPNEKIREAVRRGYANIAKGKADCCCGGSSLEKLAEAIGYTAEELKVLPDGANMGLSCGNPTSLAGWRSSLRGRQCWQYQTVPPHRLRTD